MGCGEMDIFYYLNFYQINNMKTEDKLIGLELAKKLHENGCKIESEYYWAKSIDGWKIKDKIEISLLEGSHPKLKYPAYDLAWDICVEYAKEFFGDKAFKKIEESEQNSDCDRNGLNYTQERIIIHPSITQKILALRQQGEKEVAEKYIWKHCIFNPDNK